MPDAQTTTESAEIEYNPTVMAKLASLDKESAKEFLAQTEKFIRAKELEAQERNSLVEIEKENLKLKRDALELEKEIRKNEYTLATRAQLYIFILSVLAMISGLIIALTRHPVAGAIVVGAGVGLVGASHFVQKVQALSNQEMLNSKKDDNSKDKNS